MILSNSGSTPVVPKRTAEVDPELFLRLKHGVIVDIDSTVLHLEPRAQERFKFAARDQLFAHLSLESNFFFFAASKSQHKFKRFPTISFIK